MFEVESRWRWETSEEPHKYASFNSQSLSGFGVDQINRSSERALIHF